MKPIDKKELPKLIGLVALAFGLFGFAAFQFFVASVPTATAAAPTAKPNTAVASAAGVAPGATPTPGVAGTTPTFDLASLPPPTGGNDPFLPLAGTGGGAPAPPPAPTPVAAPSAAPPTPAFSSLGGGLPLPLAKALGKATPVMFDPTPNVDGPTPTSSSGLPIQAVKAAPTPPPPPAYTVTGVVLGDRTAGDEGGVAILRGAGAGADGTDRRFVSVGDPVGNGFTVAAVHPTGVELKSGSRRVTLKLGGSAAAASPAPTGRAN